MCKCVHLFAMLCITYFSPFSRGPNAAFVHLWIIINKLGPLLLSYTNTIQMTNYFTIAFMAGYV